MESTAALDWADPSLIDPVSSVNVRSLSADNVARLALVMRSVGFLPEHPVMLRPHPDADSQFRYEVVAGQCRVAAAREVQIASIPAVISALTDDEARLRSWHENEHRSDLSASEKAHWTKFFFDRFTGEGLDGLAALQRAADELAITVGTARQYWWLAGGTAKVHTLIDSRDLQLAPARAIVEGTRMGEDYAGDASRIDERVDWYQGLAKDDRHHALAAIRAQRKEATLDDLSTDMLARRDAAQDRIELALPRVQREQIIEYGRTKGLTDIQQILGFLVASALGEREAA